METNNCTEKRGVLLGFRSDKWYKKAIAIIYLILAAVILIGGFLTNESAEDVLVMSELTVWLLAPFVFLSDFKFRDYLPLFKKHNPWMSLLGMVCVYIIINIVFTLINPAFYR